METTTNSNQRNIEAHDLRQHESKDEVDFVVVTNNNNNNNNNYDSNNIKSPTDNKKFSSNNNNSENNVPKTTNSNSASKQQQQQPLQQNASQVPNKESTHNTPKCKKKSGENSTTEPKKTSTKERLSLFSFGKKNSQKTTISNGASASSKEVPPNAPPPAMEKSSTSSLIEMGCQPMVVPIGTPPRQHKFVKSSSIARLLGNTYNAKKFEKQEEKKRVTNDTKFNTFAGRRRLSGPYLERFKRSSKEDGDVASNGGFTLTTDSRDLFGGSRSELVCLEHFQEDRNEDLSARAFRTISRGLGKLWWKRTHSVEISTPDPEFKVSYLGNVLTGWSKGEGCVEKQLNTLWRNYTQNSKPDVIMRIKVCASGLKATTRQHGLTEYWANRITHCCAPKNYPRVFCWIYRHEGRKLKHELRCHAVLCSKEKIVQDICNTLKENLERALREFKREKILKQNARLSLANAAYDNPSLPRRKILLSVGGNNYRPPLERSKSAPKLMAIEEAIGEEEGEEIEETNEPEMRACCQKDSLYPAMTLGRRRCRRGHSIRRTGKTRPNFSEAFDQRMADGLPHAEGCCGGALTAKDTKEVIAAESLSSDQGKVSECGGGTGSGSEDSDDFDKILKYNDYDTSASLANELMPYFDMQLHKNTSSSLGCLIDVLKDNEEPLSLLPTINSDPSADPEADYDPLNHNDLDDDQVVVGLRRHGVCSDGEEDYLDAEDMYFRQASILNMLHRNSMRKMQNLSQSSDESSIETNSSAPLQYRHQGQSSISSNASSTATSASTMAMEGAGATQHKQLNPDSDEGSISSGCETASTVTANQDDLSLKYRQSKHMPSTMQDGHQLSEHGILDEEQPITADEIYQRLESRLQGRHNSDATTFSSSSSITLKVGGTSPTNSVNGLEVGQSSGTRSRRTRRQSSQREQCGGGDSDSECSDESGYVEYQQVRGEKSGKSTINGGQGQVLGGTKPQPPPKPMPRKLLPTSSSTAV